MLLLLLLLLGPSMVDAHATRKDAKVLGPDICWHRTREHASESNDWRRVRAQQHRPHAVCITLPNNVSHDGRLTRMQLSHCFACTGRSLARGDVGWVDPGEEALLKLASW